MTFCEQRLNAYLIWDKKTTWRNAVSRDRDYITDVTVRKM